jgi:hypothetical protein
MYYCGSEEVHARGAKLIVKKDIYIIIAGALFGDLTDGPRVSNLLSNAFSYSRFR